VINSIKTVKNAFTGNHRVLIEKPFGHDLQSAQELNQYLDTHFCEEEIYRIDHYLGKETVQNILALRFGNSMFEPLLNNRYVESISIDVLEDIGIEGRAAYFVQTGLIKDLLQNHILQLMTMIMMEPPARMEAEFIRDEKYKVLRSLRDMDCEEVTLGQYTENTEQNLPGYHKEENIDAHSQTETFIEMDAYVDNLRWEGVPIHIRSGKRMPEKKAEIRIKFRPTFRYFVHPDAECNPHKNELVIEIQPTEQVYYTVNAKFPGRGMCIQPVNLQFTYANSFPAPTKDAYTRLFRDVVEGDQSLFIRSDEIEAAWRYVTPLIGKQRCGAKTPLPYPAGTFPQND
jgi:glucose-6-phosphate 1-dehydrogenase